MKNIRIFGRFVGLPLWDKDHDDNIIKMVIGFPMLEVRVFDPTRERVIPVSETRRNE